MISNLHDEAKAIRAYYDKRTVSLELPPYITLTEGEGYHKIPAHIAAAENAKVAK